MHVPGVRKAQVDALVESEPDPLRANVPKTLRELYSIGDDVAGTAAGNKMAVTAFLGQKYSKSSLHKYWHKYCGGMLQVVPRHARLLHVDAQQLAGAHADEFAAAGACLLVHVQGEVLALHAGAHGEERSIGGFAEVFVVGSAAAFAAGAHGAAWGGGSMLVHSQVRRQL